MDAGSSAKSKDTPTAHGFSRLGRGITRGGAAIVALLLIFSIGGLILVHSGAIDERWTTAIGAVGMLSTVGIIALMFAHATQVTRD